MVTADGAPRITGNGVSVIADGRRILAEQSFDWEAPALVCVIGPNGSGKTTLLRAVAGVTDGHSGEILVDGAPPGDRSVRAAVAYCPAAPTVFVDMSVLNQCEYIARLHGSQLTTSWWDLSDALQMTDELLCRRPVAFSSGEKQKASLLLALARPYRIAVLDEPLSALDQESALNVRSWLANSRDDERKLIVMATHEPEVIEIGDVIHDLGRRPGGDEPGTASG